MKRILKLTVVCYILLQVATANGQNSNAQTQTVLRRYPIQSSQYGNFGADQIKFSLELPAAPQGNNLGSSLKCLGSLADTTNPSYVFVKSRSANILVNILAWENEEQPCLSCVMGMLLFMGEIPEGDFKLKVSTDNKNIIIKGGNETHSKSVNGVGYIRGNKAFIVVVIYGSALSNGDSVAQQIVNSLR